MKDIDFRKLKYDIDQVLAYFELKRGKGCVVLNDWLNVQAESAYPLPDLLDEQRRKLEMEGDVWNEEELKMHFLSFVFKFADIELENKVKLFYERPLSGEVNGASLSVVCDALLASPLGINTPKKPYFFLQEFKKGKKSKDDAEGQMLVAMLIAQHLNGDDKPVFGCYLIGKDWYFTTLKGKNYCFSSSYDATRVDELVAILCILRKLKTIIFL